MSNLLRFFVFGNSKINDGRRFDTRFKELRDMTQQTAGQRPRFTPDPRYFQKLLPYGLAFDVMRAVWVLIAKSKEVCHESRIIH
jgi:hypothetical protein